MKPMKIIGRGTVIQTIFDDPLTPLKMAKKQKNHTIKTETAAIAEKLVL
jgi:hypothetical protein